MNLKQPVKKLQQEVEELKRKESLHMSPVQFLEHTRYLEDMKESQRLQELRRIHPDTWRLYA